MPPLDGIQQQIYYERGGRKVRYLLLSTVKSGQWEVALWANVEGKLQVWAGDGDATRASEIIDSIKGGMIHVEERGNNGLKLVIHAPKTPVTVYLDSEDTVAYLPKLLDGAFEVLSRPEKDNGESRVLAAKLEEREAEITSLTAKLVNLRATLARQPGGPSGSQGGRTNPTTPPKKMAAPPANASRLQPNQKRRKIQEEEFAGSDDSDDSDDSDE